MVWLEVKQVDDSLPIPAYQTEGSGGIDLYATEDKTVEVGEPQLVKTGVKMAVPIGYVGIIKSRSSLSLKGIEVGAGVIDSDYRGEVKVLFHNLNTMDQLPYDIRRGDKIAQLVVLEQPKTVIVEVNELSETKRDDGGFGSTGV